jgi:hypothetical protein
MLGVIRYARHQAKQKYTIAKQSFYKQEKRVNQVVMSIHNFDKSLQILAGRSRRVCIC